MGHRQPPAPDRQGEGPQWHQALVDHGGRAAVACLRVFHPGSGDHCVRAPYGNATRGDSEAVMVPRGSGVPYAHDPGEENRIVRYVAVNDTAMESCKTARRCGRAARRRCSSTGALGLCPDPHVVQSGSSERRKNGSRVS
jgi:hypothetical protein